MAKYNMITVDATGEKFLCTKDGLHHKAKAKVYGYVVGYKVRGASVSFTYQSEKTFLREAVTLERDVELTEALVIELFKQYQNHERSKGNRIVPTTGPRARYQKYAIIPGSSF